MLVNWLYTLVIPLTHAYRSLFSLAAVLQFVTQNKHRRLQV